MRNLPAGSFGLGGSLADRAKGQKAGMGSVARRALGLAMPQRSAQGAQEFVCGPCAIASCVDMLFPLSLLAAIASPIAARNEPAVSQALLPRQWSDRRAVNNGAG
jgi:hypothetical protein